MRKKLGRLKQKWQEHIETDPSGWSFFCYCVKYCIVKLYRQLGDLYLLGKIPTTPNQVTVAVRLTGGLGDTVIHRRFLEQIAARCPDCNFIIFCAVVKQGRWVFENAPYVKGVFPLIMFSDYRIRHADIILHLNTFAFFDEEHCHFGKILKQAPALLEMFSSCREKRKMWDCFIEKHPSLDGAFARQAVLQGFNRYNFISHLLGIPTPGPVLDLRVNQKRASELSKRFRSYITLNTGFDSYFIIAGKTATKCYPQEHWERLVVLLKEKYPGLGIVQVGNKIGKHIAGVDTDLAGKTHLDECAGILKNSRLHIDIEGGLVHICAALGTQCVTLFGPTSEEYFRYPHNINLRDDQCIACWWSTESWMMRCPRKYPRAECMYRLLPEKIMDAVSRVLGGAVP